MVVHGWEIISEMDRMALVAVSRQQGGRSLVRDNILVGQVVNLWLSFFLRFSLVFHTSCLTFHGIETYSSSGSIVHIFFENSFTTTPAPFPTVPNGVSQ